MTVGELIERLGRFDVNSEVVIWNAERNRALEPEPRHGVLAEDARGCEDMRICDGFTDFEFELRKVGWSNVQGAVIL